MKYQISNHISLVLLVFGMFGCEFSRSNLSSKRPIASTEDTIAPVEKSVNSAEKLVASTEKIASTENRQYIGNNNYCNIQIIGDSNYAVNICYFPGNPELTEPLDFNLVQLVDHGIFQYKSEQYPTAEAYFNYVIERNPPNSVAKVWRGITRVARNQCNAAVRDFKTAISMEPNKGPAYALLGYLQAWYLNDVQSAKENFARAKARIRDEAVHQQINGLIQAVDSQVDSNQLPKACPSGNLVVPTT
jgi:tetratricopeptide (TPR) repeat protein